MSSDFHQLFRKIRSGQAYVNGTGRGTNSGNSGAGRGTFGNVRETNGADEQARGTLRRK